MMVVVNKDRVEGVDLRSGDLVGAARIGPTLTQRCTGAAYQPSRPLRPGRKARGRMNRDVTLWPGAAMSSTAGARGEQSATRESSVGAQLGGFLETILVTVPSSAQAPALHRRAAQFLLATVLASGHDQAAPSNTQMDGWTQMDGSGKSSGMTGATAKLPSALWRGLRIRRPLRDEPTGESKGEIAVGVVKQPR